MSDRNPGLTADPVFLGLTRPPMRWGVPFVALLANGMVTVEAFLITGNLLWLALYIPLHAMAYALCLRDARFFELLALFLRTRAATLLANGRYWRASSYSPLNVDAFQRPNTGALRTRLVRRTLPKPIL